MSRMRSQSRCTRPVKLIASCTSSFGSTMMVTFFSSFHGTAKPTVAIPSSLGLIFPLKPLCSSSVLSMMICASLSSPYLAPIRTLSAS